MSFNALSSLRAASRVFGLAPRLIAVLALAAAAAACDTTRGATPVVTPSTQPPVQGRAPQPVVYAVPPSAAVTGAGGLTPAHMRDREVTRVALLLPFSADAAGARAEALRLLRAAELALFERGDSALLLMPRDTGGAADGARRAAEAALADGADIILGPLFGPAAVAAGEAARAAGVPVIAFSSDAEVAGGGVYLLSFPVEIEVARVVEYASRQGVERFAFIGPSTRYGETVAAALRAESALNAAAVTVEEYYSGGVEGMTGAAARLARQAGVEALDPLEAIRRQQRGWAPDETARFQAVILPEGGVRLRTLAPLLPYNDIDPLVIKFIGTGLWSDPDSLREPALYGGWFAGPDPQTRARFERAYSDVYGETPSRIASLAYDAVALAAHLDAGPERYSRRAIEDPEGFLGADGLFRFTREGRIERGLAVFEVRQRELRLIEAAPERFDPVAF